MFDPYLEWLKIPVERRPPTQYELLGLPAFESDAARIHAAAMERMALVRRYQLGEHTEIVVRLLGELSGAFNCLSRPQLRQAYDEQLRALAASITSPPAPRSIATPPPVPVACLDLRATISRGRGRRSRNRSPGAWLAAIAVMFVAVVVLVAQSWSPPTTEVPQPAATLPRADVNAKASTPRIAAPVESSPAASPRISQPPVVRDPQIRYFGYATAGPPEIISEIASYTNMVFIRDWADHSNDIIVAAQQAGLPIVLCLNNKEMAQSAAKLDTVLSRRAEAILAVCWFNPYAVGRTPAEVADFGHRIKRDHPRLQYWVAELAKPIGQNEVGFVPRVVDALVIIGVADTSADMVWTRADDYLPGWAEKAAGRPMLWYWLSGVRGSKGGMAATTEPGTLRACLDAARRYNLAGVIFDRYGQPPWQERIPIDARPELVNELRQLSRELGFDGAPRAQPAK